MTPERRVEALLAAARRAFGAGRDPALVDALAEETGLHPAGVAFALDHVLELDASRDEIRAMCARATEREAVLVVLAGNVFTAALRAIAWALAHAPRVVVRPSRRSAVFPRALIAAASDLALELVELGDAPARDVAQAAEAMPPGSAIHAYGGAATIVAIEAIARARGLDAELHGPGLGAIVADARAMVRRADAIARDVAAFDQRGCLSPRVAIAIGDVDAAADAVHAALDRLDARMPRGALDPSERSAIARARDAAVFAGRVLEGEGHLVPTGISEPGPIGRVLPLAAASSLADALAQLAPLGEDLTVIATDAEGAVARVFPTLRVVALGRMQRPPFDGPVDLRVLRRV